MLTISFIVQKFYLLKSNLSCSNETKSEQGSDRSTEITQYCSTVSVFGENNFNEIEMFITDVASEV